MSSTNVNFVMCVILLKVMFHCVTSVQLPLVVNTWGPPFLNASRKAWSIINSGSYSALDAVEKGCSVCEVEQCDGTVGYGGSPDESGDTTLDAMIMNGDTLDVGSVGCLKNIKSAIAVARSVMVHTEHTLLVGDAATQFAKEMGFKEESLKTNKSENIWKSWKKNKCQPNYWKNVLPHPETSCGPYVPDQVSQSAQNDELATLVTNSNHDTIGMIVIDQSRHVASGTSTNGKNHKITGRVGDSPIAGAGSYADSEIGGAAATGDGDIMMRFLPTYQTVENMRNGMSPKKAAEDAILRIAKYYPNFAGGVVAANINGEYGAATHQWTYFKYSVCSPNLNNSCQYFSVEPIKINKKPAF